MKLALLAGAIALSLTSAANAETVNLRFALATNAAPTVEAIKEFGKLVEQKSDGEVTVTFFPDSQLGGERELVEMVQAGTLDMTKVSGALLESFSPVYGVFSMPYLFKNSDEFHQIMSDPAIMGKVYSSTESMGVMGLTYYDSGQRSFFTANKPIYNLDDLRGLKIRVMQSPAAIEMMKELGGSPIAMGAGEVYTALQQGVIDGAESNEFALTSNQFGEVAKFYSYDMHARIPDIVLIGTSTLKRLTESQKAAVFDAAKESTQFQREKWEAAVDQQRKIAIEKYGVKFNDVDQAPFQAAVQPIYDRLKDDETRFSLYSEIHSVLSAK